MQHASFRGVGRLDISQNLYAPIPRPLHSVITGKGLRHFITASDIVSRLRLRSAKPTPAHRTSLSTQHIRQSSVFDCWSDGLELTA